jgi:hypothetical protein
MSLVYISQSVAVPDSQEVAFVTATGRLVVVTSAAKPEEAVAAAHTQPQRCSDAQCQSQFDLSTKIIHRIKHFLKFKSFGTCCKELFAKLDFL